MVRGTTWDLASPAQEHPWRKRAKLYCGSGNDLTYRFPVIVEAIAKLRVRSCIIDGEAVACGDDGLASFDRIRYRQNDASVFMWAFDVIELDGDDLRIDPCPGPHILTGPIEVRGAEPGDVLEVRILEINLAIDYGFKRQRSYTGALPDEFTALWTRIIPINRQAKTAEVAKGVVVALDKPFFGVMGLAPDSSMGRISSGPPGVHAGNMDNKDLVAGTTLCRQKLRPRPQDRTFPKAD